MSSLSSVELNQTGALLQIEGDNEGARLHYLAALLADPNNWMALGNLGALLSGQGKLESAVIFAKKATALAPGDGRQVNNLGNILMRLNRFGESREVLSKAREIAPEDSVTWQNLALLDYREGRFEAALKNMETGLRLSPDNHVMQCDRGHILLALGRLQSGLAAYENRWHTLLHLEPWNLRVPEWKGEDLENKHLLFHSEQGFGDAIMMGRFAKDLVSKHNCTVTMALPLGLVRLFNEQNWPGVRVANLEDLGNLGSYNFHSPMFSALRWLGYEKEDITPEPYIKSVDIPGGPNNQIRVGICWASGKWNTETALRRTIGLELFLPLTVIPEVELWSLQKGEGEGDIKTLGAEGLIRDEIGLCKDWADTRDLISRLDLVIAVDTAVAHLAGAMGKPVWMLSPYTRCWRWWDIENRTGWPWYQQMSIFPQKTPDGWKSTIEDVADTLIALCNLRNTLKEAAD